MNGSSGFFQLVFTKSQRVCESADIYAPNLEQSQFTVDFFAPTAGFGSIPHNCALWEQGSKIEKLKKSALHQQHTLDFFNFRAPTGKKKAKI